MKKYIFLVAAFFGMVLCGCEIQDKQIQSSLPVVMTEGVTSVTSNTAVLQVEVLTTETLYYDVRLIFEWDIYSSFLTPSHSEAQTINLAINGGRTITCPITDLMPGTKYFFRARIEKFDSRYSNPIYSDVCSFVTESLPASITVVTGETKSVTSCTARSYGSATVYRCTLKESGMLLTSNGSTPTVSSYLYRRYGTYTDYSGFWYNLNPSTTYKVRAYAIDTDGNVYYGDTRSFTTKSESGGSLTVSDFAGTHTVSAYSPWENKYVTWTNVKIAVYTADTVVAYGWDNKTYFRAIGIFDKGRQVIRFESGWYFPAQTFTYDSKTCVAQFWPCYYNSSDETAYYVVDGGRFQKGEIWMKKTGTNSFQFIESDGDDKYGRYANGFIFAYMLAPDAETKVGHSYVYTNVKFTRTSTSASMPARMPEMNDVISSKSINDYDTQDALENSARFAMDCQ